MFQSPEHPSSEEVFRKLVKTTKNEITRAEVNSLRAEELEEVAIIFNAPHERKLKESQAKLRDEF